MELSVPTGKGHRVEQEALDALEFPHPWLSDPLLDVGVQELVDETSSGASEEEWCELVDSEAKLVCRLQTLLPLRRSVEDCVLEGTAGICAKSKLSFSKY